MITKCMVCDAPIKNPNETKMRCGDCIDKGKSLAVGITAAPDTGGNAFPATRDELVDVTETDPDGTQVTTQALQPVHYDGMTLQDYLAAKAMEGKLACPEPGDEDDTAARCYDIADRMIEEKRRREKRD